MAVLNAEISPSIALAGRGRWASGVVLIAWLGSACAKSDQAQCEGACGESTDSNDTQGDMHDVPQDDVQGDTDTGGDGDVGSTDEDPFEDCVEPDDSLPAKWAYFVSETWQGLFDPDSGSVSLEDGLCYVDPDSPYPADDSGFQFDLTCTRAADESVHEGTLHLSGENVELGALAAIAGTDIRIQFEYGSWVGVSGYGLLRVGEVEGGLLLFKMGSLYYPNGKGGDGWPEYTWDGIALPLSEEVQPGEWFSPLSSIRMRDDLCPAIEVAGNEDRYRSRLAYEIVGDEAVLAFDQNHAVVDADGAVFDFYAGRALAEWTEEQWEDGDVEYSFFMLAQ